MEMKKKTVPDIIWSSAPYLKAMASGAVHLTGILPPLVV